ncbi:hypothetical protein [Aliiruegeria sabulilitoris]|uniref:hypothetical protein n=1 Tax=Aliiruegeria sabulilitoris TaxID=1510458 RepID=UPI00082D8648|nr:hypothetical protein [Aliiruegeria sabulilitoris]NDR59630.1 hypothetical protein [Pseudoruegeria sp. M32A2M]
MGRPAGATKAINLRIEYEHEQLVRDVIGRIRQGGPGFRAALKALIADEAAAEYVPAAEIHARFAALEKRLPDDAAAAALETRIKALETRLAEVETLAFERITRLGADSCGG